MTPRRSWQLQEAGRPLVRQAGAVLTPRADWVVVRVAGCGVCHTDLSFFSGDVRPRAGLPIVLGHEVAGTVEAAGQGAEGWMGRAVIVPAVIPCGDCRACSRSRGNACSRQFMPGNDGDGGFATHLSVPARGLCPVERLPPGHSLADLAVIADAVSTPFQALRRARVGQGDLVVVVGVGGVGTHAVQVAAALGATVVAVDVDDRRLEAVRAFGGALSVCSAGLSPRDLREAMGSVARTTGAAPDGWKVVECSGTPGGQEAAFGLVTSTGVVALVGYTREAVRVRLSNLMAFDAEAFGSWGCPVELYPDVLTLVDQGRITLAPFVRHVDLDSVNELFTGHAAARDARRPILIP